MVWRGWSFLWLALVAQGAWAATVVEGVRMPAWLVRGGERLPLEVGMELRAGDRLYTGAHGGLAFTPDGVAQLGLNESAMALLAAPEGTEAGVELFRGGFHYSTGRGGRPLALKTPSLSMTLERGGVLGEVDEGREAVMLIAGRARLRQGEAHESLLDRPAAYFEVGGEAGAEGGSSLIDAQRLARLRERAMPAAGSGWMGRGGRWKVYLISLRGTSSADQLAARFRQAGYAVGRREVEVEGERWYRLVVEGFLSSADARAFAGRIQGKFGIGEPWITD